MASLAHTNKHLATAEQRKRIVRLTIATSSAIEGIHAPFKPRKAAAKTQTTLAKLRSKPGKI